MTRFLTRLAAVSLIVLSALAARAEVVVDNLSQVGGENTNLNTNQVGQAFTTGANAGTLSSIVLPLNATFGAPTVTVSIHPYSTTSFPAAIATVNTAVVSAAANYTFTPTSTISLPANTSFWIVTSASLFTARWRQTASTVFTGTGSLPTTPTAAISTDGGASLALSFNLSDGPQQLQVNLAPVVVPESGTLALVGVGCSVLGVGVVRRRK